MLVFCFGMFQKVDFVSSALQKSKFAKFWPNLI